MSQKKYSFVILTYNSEKYIKRCLEDINCTMVSLQQDAEVFVVDNGSKDRTKNIIKEIVFDELVDFHLIEFSQNTGTTFSRNSALKQCIGDYVIIMDSDAYVNDLVLRNLAEYLEGNPDCGLAVPKLVYLDMSYQMSTDNFPTIIRKIQRYIFLKKLEKQATP